MLFNLTLSDYSLKLSFILLPANQSFFIIAEQLFSFTDRGGRELATAVDAWAVVGAIPLKRLKLV